MTLLRAVKFSRSATNDKQQVVLSHVLSAVRKKPRFKKKKKHNVTLCLPLLNVCHYYDKIVTFCPPPHNILIFIRNIVKFCPLIQNVRQKFNCFVYYRSCIIAFSNFQSLQNSYKRNLNGLSRFLKCR